MKAAAATAAILVSLAPLAPAQARPISFQRLDPNAYQSFVGNWTPDSQPLCAAVRSEEDWSRVMHPAPTAAPGRPFSPGAGFWTGHVLLLVAHVIGAGDASGVYKAPVLRRDGRTLELSYTFSPTPSAASTIKWPLMIAVTKPLPTSMRFFENGKATCFLRPGAGAWVTPALAR